MTDPTELDELESGLTHGLFLRLQKHAVDEWGPAGKTYLDAVQKAITGGLGTEAESVARLKMIAHTQVAIQELMQWPSRRVAVLKNMKEIAEMSGGPSRRGRGL